VAWMFRLSCMSLRFYGWYDQRYGRQGPRPRCVEGQRLADASNVPGPRPGATTRWRGGGVKRKRRIASPSLTRKCQTSTDIVDSPSSGRGPAVWTTCLGAGAASADGGRPGSGRKDPAASQPPRTETTVSSTTTSQNHQPRRLSAGRVVLEGFSECPVIGLAAESPTVIIATLTLRSPDFHASHVAIAADWKVSKTRSVGHSAGRYVWPKQDLRL
jgi:hypothetical protein